jgi:hypothetical protein
MQPSCIFVKAGSQANGIGKSDTQKDNSMLIFTAVLPFNYILYNRQFQAYRKQIHGQVVRLFRGKKEEKKTQDAVHGC